MLRMSAGAVGRPDLPGRVVEALSDVPPKPAAMEQILRINREH
jgi:hypothetical protein